MIHNLIPEVLWIGPLLVPLLLRVATGPLLITLAFKMFRHSTGLPRTKLQISVSALYAAVGLLLLLGLFTQYAALAGIVISSALLFFGKRFPSLRRESALFYLLLEAVLFSLVLTGAGPLSLDSPL